MDDEDNDDDRPSARAAPVPLARAELHRSSESLSHPKDAKGGSASKAKDTRPTPAAAAPAAAKSDSKDHASDAAGGSKAQLAARKAAAAQARPAIAATAKHHSVILEDYLKKKTQPKLLGPRWVLRYV